MMRHGLVVIGVGVACIGCSRSHAGAAPLTPAVVKEQPAIPYPPDLYGQRVEGEVMLYLVVDSSGNPLRDSTRVATSSGQPAFDAAALIAAASLHFVPAHRDGVAVEAPIRVPIQFHLPDSLRPKRARP